MVVPVLVDAGPAATSLLVAQAQARLRVAEPAVHLAPPGGGLHLAGVAVWFWTDPARPMSATASIPGLSATVTAMPGPVRLDVDHGSDAHGCTRGGTPWDPGRSGRVQHSDCTHTFETAGRHGVDVSVDWQLAWTASNGTSGTLPTLRRTTHVDLTIREAQAVTD